MIDDDDNLQSDSSGANRGGRSGANRESGNDGNRGRGGRRIISGGHQSLRSLRTTQASRRRVRRRIEWEQELTPVNERGDHQK